MQMDMRVGEQTQGRVALLLDPGVRRSLISPVSERPRVPANGDL